VKEKVLKCRQKQINKNVEEANLLNYCSTDNIRKWKNTASNKKINIKHYV